MVVNNCSSNFNIKQYINRIIIRAEIIKTDTDLVERGSTTN